MWVHPNVDMYLVTAGIAEPAVLRFRPDAKVQVVSPPVRPAFYHARSQVQASRSSACRPASALRAADVRRLGPRTGGRGRRAASATRACTCSPWPGTTGGWSASSRRRRPPAAGAGVRLQRPHPGSDVGGGPGHHELWRHVRGGPHDRPAAAAAGRRAGARPRQSAARAGTGRRDGQLGRRGRRHPVRHWRRWTGPSPLPPDRSAARRTGRPGSRPGSARSAASPRNRTGSAREWSGPGATGPRPG